MKKRFAVVCAFPADLNPGMLSVDLAAGHLLARAGDETEIQLFSPGGSADLAGPHASLRYRLLTSPDELQDFDAIVFWGDFPHWIAYGKEDYMRRQQRRSPQLSDARIMDSWYQLLLLEGRPDLQRKSVVFGSSIYGLQAGDLTDERYLSALKHLYGNARLVQLRDAYSAVFARQLGSLSHDPLGCDCAMLLDTSSWAPALAINRPYLACSFGRSGNNITLKAFASVIAGLSGLDVLTIDWLDDTGLTGLDRKLSLIKGARLVLTDTYHMAVSALRERTPVLCAGWATRAIEGTVSDKKKEIFFQQSLLSKNYLYMEDVADSLRSDARAIELARAALDVVTDSRANAIAFDGLRQQAALAGQRCREALGLHPAAG